VAYVRALCRTEIAWHMIATASAALISLALIAKVGEDVFEHESGSFDAAVRAWFLAHRTPFGETFFLWITRVGATAPVIAAAVVIGAWLWYRRGRRVGAGVVFAPAAAVAVYDTAKLVYARARPAGALAAGISTYSFPSGHSTTAAAVVITVVYVLWRERLLARDLAVAIGILVPLLVGVSRVYLDVHWATDVLGGWAVGIFIFGLCATAYERERRRMERAAARRSVAAA
jgi:undecaprenyl-diphosphatase